MARRATRLTRARRAATAGGRAALLAVAVGLAPAVATAQERLPDFGDASAGTLSPAEEAELGKIFMREIRRSLPLVDDWEVNTYISSLGGKLGAGLGVSLSFFVVQQDVLNAFAGPGGYIGINSGLFIATDTESELASVMAHEIAHVDQRHIARSIELQDRGALPALAGIIAAVLIGTQNPQAGQAVAAGVTGFQTQRLLDFIRANELEADRIGMRLLDQANFDPRGMPAFFEKLQSASRYYSQPPEYLSTHPVTSNRIADTRGRAEQYDYRQREDSASYHFVKAKLRVITARDAAAVQEAFEAELKERRYRHLGATAYGLGLALSANREFARAHTVLSKLAQEHPERVGVRVAIADNLLREGKVDEAGGLFADAYALYPDDAAVVRGHASALLAAKQPDEALGVLTRYRRASGPSAGVYKLEAEAHAAAGRTASSQMALAEHLVLSGQLDAAINQLRQAASAAAQDDLVTRERAAARLRELEEERLRVRGR